MLNPEKYIVNGVVEREKIVLDIKRNPLTEEELSRLINDERIRSAFIGKNYKEKKPEAEWSEEYLNQLTYAVVAEAFNEDYLRYLNKVSAFVNNKKRREHSSTVLGLASAGVLTAGLIGYYAFLKARGKNLNSNKTTKTGDLLNRYGEKQHVSR